MRQVSTSYACVLFHLQLTVQATSRLRSAFATVRILITRQIDQMPFFVNTPYRRTIFVNQLINETVISVSARDNDLVVSVFGNWIMKMLCSNATENCLKLNRQQMQ